MKKISLLILALLVILSGCALNEKPAAYASVTSSADGQARIIYFDEDLKKMAEMKAGQVSDFCRSGNIVYLSDGQGSWQGYYIDHIGKANRIRNVDGQLIYGMSDGSYLHVSDDKVFFHPVKGEEFSQPIGPMIIYHDREYLYIVDDSGNSTYFLRTYDLSSLQQIDFIRLPQDGYVGFLESQGQTCLVSYRGISPISEGKIEQTFVYPVQFSEIDNCFADLIFGYENGELTVYRVSFSAHRMILDLELDERYYREINLDELLADQLAEGGRIICFAEAEN